MSGFIIVRRDGGYLDFGVFTGRMALVESSRRVGTETPLILGEGEFSQHIEHGFIFRDEWQAWRWCDRLLPDQERYRQGVEFLSLDVRKAGDFEVGRFHQWGSVARPSFVRLIDEQVAMAFQEGVAEGYRRADEAAA